MMEAKRIYVLFVEYRDRTGKHLHTDQTEHNSLIQANRLAANIHTDKLIAGNFNIRTWIQKEKA